MEEEAPRLKPPPGSVLPIHLQDLQEGDLPEEQRGQVLSQINAFREQSAKRERQKKLEEEGRERYRVLQSNQGPGSSFGRPPPAGPSARGPQTGSQRPQAHDRSHPARGQDIVSSPPTDSQTTRPDPQSYSRPVSFVPAKSAESKEQTERTDEEQEQVKRQQKLQEHNRALRDVSQSLDRVYAAHLSSVRPRWRIGKGIGLLARRRRWRTGSSRPS